MNAGLDQNSRQTLIALSSAGDGAIVQLYANPITHRLLVDSSGGGSGTVTQVDTGTGLTGGPITTTGTIQLNSKLAPLDTLGTAGQYVRVNAGATALEYATLAAGGTVTSVSVVSANGFAGTVATATTTPAITLTTTITGFLQGNGSAISAATTTGSGSTLVLATSPTITTAILNGTVTGTGVSQSSSASTLVQRDANQNIFVNNIFANYTSTVSAAGTTVLTVASSRYQALTGTNTQTFQLPNATTLSLGQVFSFNNASSSSLVITNNGASTLYTVPAGGAVETFVTNIGSANGSWDFHALTPSTVTWGSGVTGLVFNTALSTTPQINAGASSSTNPSFIPQRGSATNGYGGDSTNLYGIIGGTAAFTSSATNFTVPALNKVTITAPATSATLTIANGKTLTVNNTLTLAGTDSTTMTFPTTSASIARTDAAQTFTGAQTYTNAVIYTNNAVTATGNAATVPVTARLTTVTNNSAATLTITLTTSGAVDGQLVMVRVYDFSAVAQTLTWVNTENSTATVPTTSNGSTTLPKTVGFQYNGATSLWRCIASA